MFATDAVVIYDLEWTAWPESRAERFAHPDRPPEIIQIGAVAVSVADGFAERGHFETLVRPTLNPVLSDYIVDLTGIRQADVDRDGVDFAPALDAFLAFVGTGPVTVACYGNDSDFVQVNCTLKNLPMPARLVDYVDLRAALDARGLVDRTWNSGSLAQRLGIEDEGREHNALDDVRTIVRALRHFRDAGKI